LAQVNVGRRRRVLVDLARIFSTICNPFLTALTLFVIMAHAEATSTAQFWELLFVSTAFTSIGPMLFVLLALQHRPDRRPRHVGAQRARARLRRLRAVLLGRYGVLWLIHAPTLIVATMGGYAAASLVVQYITRYWKISTHALGITASLSALVHLYGQQPLPFLVLIPIVGWSRVYLKAHTVLQVVGGTALGGAAVLLFYRIFKV
jgi:membrane-associated phospholipid phosphatase